LITSGANFNVNGNTLACCENMLGASNMKTAKTLKHLVRSKGESPFGPIKASPQISWRSRIVVTSLSKLGNHNLAGVATQMFTVNAI